MAVIRHSQKSDFKPSPQHRVVGSGAGRKMFPWKRKLPWLVMAAEQLCVVASGSADGLLEIRCKAVMWGIRPGWLGEQIEGLFPGISSYLDLEWSGKTDWRKNLLNRVYKMYYSGTSDRGVAHDPTTRAAMSREHWRNWPVRNVWESKVLYLVSHQVPTPGWRKWV